MLFPQQIPGAPPSWYYCSHVIQQKTRIRDRTKVRLPLKGSAGSWEEDPGKTAVNLSVFFISPRDSACPRHLVSVKTPCAQNHICSEAWEFFQRSWMELWSWRKWEWYPYTNGDLRNWRLSRFTSVEPCGPGACPPVFLPLTVPIQPPTGRVRTTSGIS